MSSKMTLYLRILVSAPAAEIQALNSAGGSYPRSGYDIMSSKMTLYLRILVTAPAAEIQALILPVVHICGADMILILRTYKAAG